MRWHYAILAAMAPACEATATPAVLMACTGATDVTKCLTSAQYDAIVAAVRGQLESLSATCTASDCPQADWAGCVLRMAGHDFMDFANGQGGSDACTDMEDPENAGLPECLASGEHGKSLQEVYNQYCLDVSLADFLVIAAEAVIASTRARYEDASPGAPHLDLRAAFKFGRQTASSCDFAVGRLPNPERGCDAVDETFVQRMGLDWTQAAALMGVHTLGRAKVANSGYHGWWSDPENSRRFNNNYYISLVAKGWTVERAISGNVNKNQWERSDTGRDTSVDGHEMMLNTDMCLAFSEMEGPRGPGGTPVLAHEHQCCGWVTSDRISAAISSNGGVYCGGRAGGRLGDERDRCCGNENNDCGDPRNPNGPAAAAVLSFANDESAWVTSFAAAWKIATENGHGALRSLGECGTSSTSSGSTGDTSGGAEVVTSTTGSSSTVAEALGTSTTDLSSTATISAWGLIVGLANFF